MEPSVAKRFYFAELVACPGVTGLEYDGAGGDRPHQHHFQEWAGVFPRLLPVCFEKNKRGR